MILTAAARKCPKCGESLHELAQFCPACGDEQGARVASSAVPVVPQSRLRERLPLIAVRCAVVLIGVTAVWSRHRTAQQEQVSDGTTNAKTGLVKQIDPPSDDPPLRTIWPNSSLPQLLPRKAHYRSCRCECRFRKTEIVGVVGSESEKACTKTIQSARSDR
jgi:hypothetical protein